MVQTKRFSAIRKSDNQLIFWYPKSDGTLGAYYTEKWHSPYDQIFPYKNLIVIEPTPIWNDTDYSEKTEYGETK